MSDHLVIFLGLCVVCTCMGVGMFLYVNYAFEKMRIEAESEQADEGW